MKPPTIELNNPKNQHIVWLDVVRLIAMFTVVCCHCTDPFNFYPGTAPNIGEIKLWELAPIPPQIGSSVSQNIASPIPPSGAPTAIFPVFFIRS